MASTPLKELPNFEAMAQSFEAIARQFRLFYNLPGYGNLPGCKDQKDSPSPNAPAKTAVDALKEDNLLGCKDQKNSLSPNAPAKTAVDALTEDIATMKICLDHINGRCELMERRILTDNAAREINNIIRVENLYRRDVGRELIPLHSVLTNTEIGAFPRSVDDFRNLTSETVTEILRELNDPFAGLMHGDAVQTRQRLAILAGIRN
ncbi:hypothetical protein GGR51DRAFT_536689, partial [Nemania sp. FL0031]